MKCSIVFLLAALATNAQANERLELVPTSLALSVEYRGATQAGERSKVFEIRELASRNTNGKLSTAPFEFYIVYHRDSERRDWAPTILLRVKGHHPFLRRIDSEHVALIYMPGVNTHAKQTWKLPLSGHEPTLEKEESIDWREAERLTKQ